MSTIYLAIALPKITLDAPLELSRMELNDLLEQNLSQSEQNKIKEIRAIRDIENTLLWIQDKEMVLDGSIPKSEYRTALFEEDKNSLPKPIFEFIRQYQTQEERKKESDRLFFSLIRKKIISNNNQTDSLLSSPFDHTRSTTVEKIYCIEYLSRIFLGYLRSLEAKKEELIQLSITEMLEKLNLSYQSEEEWPFADFSKLKVIWAENKQSPLSLEKAIFEWKFSSLEHLLNTLHNWILPSSFTLDEILIYCAQYDLVEMRQIKKEIDYRKLIENISKKTERQRRA